MKKIFSGLIVLFLLTAVAAADIHIRMKVHSDAFAVMGQSQPEKNEVTDQWMSDDRFAAIGQDHSTIIDLKKNLLFLINHQDKTYIETSLPLDLSKIYPPEMAQMLATMMKMTVTVTPLGQTKTIGSWKCSGYEVNLSMMMMPLKMTVWASTEVPFDANQFTEKYFTNIMKIQMRLDDVALAELKKIKGYWIAYEQTGEIMGAKIHSTMEVTEIKKEDAPPSVYTVPAGYKKTEKLSLRS